MVMQETRKCDERWGEWGSDSRRRVVPKPKEKRDTHASKLRTVNGFASPHVSAFAFAFVGGGAPIPAPIPSPARCTKSVTFALFSAGFRFSCCCGTTGGGADAGVSIFALANGLAAHGLAPSNSGIRAVCTLVYPPAMPILAPPQKRAEEEAPMSLRVCARGRSSFFVAALEEEEDDGEDAEEARDGERERGAGGGRTGAGPRLSNNVRLSAAISCRSARFSLCVEPNSDRMAERRRSRSAMLSSRVDMYSKRGMSQ